MRLKLSDRFFKSEDKFQKYKKGAKRKLVDEKQSAARIALFSAKKDAEYEENENKIVGASQSDGEKPENISGYEAIYRL